MKKLSQINEDIFDTIFKKDSEKDIRKEDIAEQNPHYWWRYIELKPCKKYPKDEVRSYDISYPIVARLEKTLNIKSPDYIDIYFRYEVWDLIIEHNTAYGSDTYAMNVHGEYSPWFEKYSNLTLNEKRSIKQRLDEKTFYIYKYKGMRTEYILREDSEWNNQKGILLK